MEYTWLSRPAMAALINLLLACLARPEGKLRDALALLETGMLWAERGLQDIHLPPQVHGAPAHIMHVSCP